MDFSNAKWIWIHDTVAQDEYGEFFDILNYSGGTAGIGLSCDAAEHGMCLTYDAYQSGKTFVMI